MYYIVTNYFVKRRSNMKKIMGFIIAFMLIFSSLVYAGGDKNCGSKGLGDTGKTATGAATQERTPTKS